MATQRCSSSQHSVVSPNGVLIATLQQSRLIISSSRNREVIRKFPLPQDFVSRCRFLRWCGTNNLAKDATKEQGNGHCEQTGQILLADDDAVRIYNVNDPAWLAVIDKAASNLGRIAEVIFGHTKDEIVVVSDFGVKLTIWSLLTSRGVEIRHPKCLVKCFHHRPRTGHLAILTRPAAQDVLMLLQPKSHDLVKSVEMPTIDAQEVAWSPDGSWLATRDTASTGYKVLIYTADGHLYKTISNSLNGVDISLGVKCMQWSPSAGTLAIGDNNDSITIFSKNNFSPIANLHHPATITLPKAGVWEEQVNALKERSYVAAPQPASPPTSLSLGKSNNPSYGISVIAFNSDGSLVASRNDVVPTTVWIWSLSTGTAIDVLIHHSPVKQIIWHPSQSDLLLIHCAIPEPAIHLWKTTWHAPRILMLPLLRIGGRLEASWLKSLTDESFNLMISSAHQYTTVRISPDGEVIAESIPLDAAALSIDTGAEDMFDEGNSLDLSPIKISHSTVEVSGYGDDHFGSGFGFTEEMLDDTFHYRRHVKAVN
ncbi:hypothetical protein HO173_010064 [Letharia columbiana]|uniref:Uncharacterized protein n=1 Tax=Letharia columbiana TaxID=112416 RepID=A0A8H6FNF5_9LECA|nr:uncharacterized protein HO173_010064 [Letharia columbiana]KAF6231762.1 hypothetical protein HO173_010064 [Letharia columbiana]